MIQDRTSVFPKAFTELTLELSDVLKVAPFTFYHWYMRFFEWQDMESVIFFLASSGTEWKKICEKKTVTIKI